MVAALLVVWALGVAIVFFAKGTSSPSAPAAGHVVQTSSQAPDAQERNAQILSAQRATQDLTDQDNLTQ